ncbi:MAG: M28 family peptidase [Lewinella sp.]|nr:M28 family peptidase [Lewinella sp.]
MQKFSTLALLLISSSLWAQSTYELPEFQLDKDNLEMQMRFLASDYLAGRYTGSPGNDIAAEFIAAHLDAYGYQPAPGQDNFFQPVPFKASTPPSQSSLSINRTSLTAGDEFLILAGPAINVNADGVFAGYGWVDEENDHDDYAGLDVEGKVVFVLAGQPGNHDPRTIFRSMRTKRQIAEEHGAVALIEFYQVPFPWSNFVSYFGGESLQLDDNEEEAPSKVVYGFLNSGDKLPFADIQQARRLKVALSSTGFAERRIYSNNVCGVLEGSDPELKNEYVILTAHFDHVGVGKQGGRYTEQDSIFNGARDNAFGTISLLAAAKSLAQERPKRSVIILAVTGEEIGLLGSRYYAEHPLIPNEQVVFNLNTDGAGYNDTGAIAVMGWGRTGTDEALQTGVAPFGLDIIKDPAPEQGLFDRSDNVSFARVGIPAMCFSPGFREFDAEIMAYYHQVTDEADSIDYGYLKRYCQAFAYTARQIANMATRPQWVEGDKYEEAAKELYNY